MALRKAQQRKNRFKASREDRKEGEPIELDRSRSLPAEPSGPRRKRRNSSLSVAPPPAPPRSPAKKGDVAWHLHQALEASLQENDKLKAELARYKAAYGELPRDGRRAFR